MFVETPVLEVPVVVEYVQPTPVVEYMANTCGVRDSSAYRCLSGPGDHIDSGADSTRNHSADRHGANRHWDSVEGTPVAQQSLLPTAQTAQKTEEFPQVRHIVKSCGCDSCGATPSTDHPDRTEDDRCSSDSVS